VSESEVAAGPLEGGICVDRALRLLASVALLCFGLSIAWFVARRTGQALPLITLQSVQVIMALVAQTAYSLGFAAGVVALVACTQRRQRGWGVGLAGLLLLTIYSIPVAYFVLPVFGLPALAFFYQLGYVYLAQLIPALLLTLLALLYSVIPRRLAVTATPQR
jgi:hypothetical protein